MPQKSYHHIIFSDMICPFQPWQYIRLLKCVYLTSHSAHAPSFVCFLDFPWCGYPERCISFHNLPFPFFFFGRPAWSFIIFFLFLEKATSRIGQWIRPCGHVCMYAPWFIAGCAGAAAQSYVLCSWCCRSPHYLFLFFWVGEDAFAERGFDGKGLYVCQCSSCYQSSTPECASLANPPSSPRFELFDFPIERMQLHYLARLRGLLGYPSIYTWYI